MYLYGFLFQCPPHTIGIGIENPFARRSRAPFWQVPGSMRLLPQQRFQSAKARALCFAVAGRYTSVAAMLCAC